ncbi:MAG: hypothetical protein NC203_00265, partial [Firmicutes bacterium]|nr:hypothetical protein [Bacillota bacterium]
MAFGFVFGAGSGNAAEEAVKNHNSSADAHSQIFAEINKKIDDVETKADTAIDKAANGVSVSFTRTLDNGTKIGTITVNGVDTDLYCESDTNTVYSNATTSSAGLMSAADKA